MSDLETGSDDRRTYFRIDDQMRFLWHAISPEEKADALAANAHMEGAHPDARGLFLKLDTLIRDSLARVKIHHSEIAHTLEMLNKKVNYLAYQIPEALPEHVLLQQKSRHVNISAKGISFNSEAPSPVGLDVVVEMLLSTNDAYLQVYGRITSSERIDSTVEMYRIGIDFDAINEDDMERLVQHIMRLESQLIRKNKSNPSD